MEGQYIEQGEGQCHIELAHHAVGPVGQGIGLLKVELADKDIDQQGGVGQKDVRPRLVGAEAPEGQHQESAPQSG